MSLSLAFPAMAGPSAAEAPTDNIVDRAKAGLPSASRHEVPLATVVFSAQRKPTHKFIEWDGEAGEFRQLSQKNHHTLDTLYHVCEVSGPITLERRGDLRRELTNIPTASLVSGVLRPEFYGELEPYGSTLRTRESHCRSLKTFCDAKLPFFVADIEHFDTRRYDSDFDARAGVQNAHDVLRDMFDDIGADFLISDHLIQASSRFGLTERHEFRGHVEWLLRDPLTLAEQKWFAQWLNSKCENKGLCPIFDTTVYDAAHFLFTSRAGFVRKAFVGGKVECVELDGEELKNIGIDVRADRVSLRQDTGEPLLDLPEDLASELAANPPALRRAKSRRTGFNPESRVRKSEGAGATGHLFRMDQIREIRDGNTHEPVIRIVSSVSNERRERWPQICARYLQLAVKRINETSPDSTSRERRIEDHARLDLWLQWCSDARAKFDASGDGDSRRRLVVDKAPRARTALPDVPTARECLNSDLKRVVKEAFAYDPNKLVGLGLIHQREKPTFTVFDAAPGLGKSTGVMAAIQPYICGNKKVIIAVPTTKLADDLKPDLLSLLEKTILEQGITDADDVSRKINEQMRIIRGRKKLCIDEEGFGVDAAELEDHGISPAPICKVCTKRDTCPYAQQDKTLAPITVMVHAHLPTSIRKLSEDADIGLLVIDESILSTLTEVPHCGATWPLAELEREARRATAPRRKKRKKDKAGRQSRVEITADLVASLSRINKILNSPRIAANGVGRIAVSALAPLKAIRQNAKKVPISAIDEAFSEVRNWENGAREALGNLIKERADRRAARQEVRDLSLEIKKIKTTIECAAFYGVILEAFRGSLDNPARTEETDTVMGCWLFESRGEVCVHAYVHGHLPARLADVPIIALDGTANEDALRSIVGRSHDLRFVKTPVAPPTGSYHLVQYPDSPYGWTKFVDLESRKGRRALTEIWKTICVEAARDYGEATCQRKDGTRIDVLVACQVAVEEALNKIGLPPNVETIHFNAERGVNAYAGVSCAFVIGRPMLKTPDLEAKAEALHYDDRRVKVIHSTGDQKLVPGRRWLEMTDGSQVEIAVESHPDPHVDVLVRSQVDDEARQAAHRLRIYSRTSQNPARLFVFGQCDVGLPVHEICRKIDGHRDVADLMLASGVVILDRKYVEIAHKNWIGASDRGGRGLTDAMRVMKEWDKIRSHTAISIMDTLIGSAVRETNLSHFTRVEVKHPRPRYRGAVLIDPRRYPDITKAIADTFGPDVQIVETDRHQKATVASTARRSLSLFGRRRKSRRGRPRHENPSASTLRKRLSRARKAANHT